MKRKWTAGMVIGALMMSACAGLSDGAGRVYKLYPGPERPDSEVATLAFGDRVYAMEVDGLEVSAGDYSEVKLLPGEHRINWGATFAVSVMVNPAMSDRADSERTVNLAAGKRYTVEADRTTGPGYRMFLWIEDTETGEAVVGHKKTKR